MVGVGVGVGGCVLHGGSRLGLTVPRAPASMDSVLVLAFVLLLDVIVMGRLVSLMLRLCHKLIVVLVLDLSLEFF